MTWAGRACMVPCLITARATYRWNAQTQRYECQKELGPLAAVLADMRSVFSTDRPVSEPRPARQPLPTGKERERIRYDRSVGALARLLIWLVVISLLCALLFFTPLGLIVLDLLGSAVTTVENGSAIDRMALFLFGALLLFVFWMWCEKKRKRGGSVEICSMHPHDLRALAILPARLIGPAGGTLR